MKDNMEDNMEDNKEDNMKDKEEPILICPNCHEYIIIEKLNCGIFRHGIYKTNGQQIPPHSSKDICDKLIKQNTIYGCGKPFRVLIKDNKYEIEECDYI